jgi:uncharacterized protein YceK
MKNILFSVLMAFAVMSLTTGCSTMGHGDAKKCGASGKCGGDKKEVKKADKKCGAEKNGKCGSSK